MVRFFECLLDDAHWISYPCGQIVIFYRDDCEGFPINLPVARLEKEIWHGTVKEVTPH